MFGQKRHARQAKSWVVTGTLTEEKLHSYGWVQNKVCQLWERRLRVALTPPV